MTDFRRHMPEASDSLKRRRTWWSYTHLDATMLLLLMTLCAFGLFVLYSASGESQFYVKRQFIHMVAGFTALIILAQFPPSFLGRWSILGYALAIILLIMVAEFGVGAKGAKRWLQLPGFRFQ
ncbi:MAG: FtsW/RodA/SpoVE family cell cycle protein, partial [Pontibacterium sp.]